MTAQPPATSYESRLRRVIRHIADHPDGDLSLDALCEVAGMSRFHFARVFHAMTGETAAQAVRRLRLHRAAFDLTRGTDPVDRIAARSGYDNADSFVRAFKALYGMTPTAFRQAGRSTAEAMTFTTVPTGVTDMTDTYPTELRVCPALRLAALEHRGPYHEIGRSFSDLATLFATRGLFPQARALVGIYHDSPEDTPQAELRSTAGMDVAEGFEMPDDLTRVDVPGGEHLVLTMRGPYTGLPAAWGDLYGTALPASGRLPADRPPYEYYLNNPMDTAPEDLLTEIRVPLA
ncbi:AraC family transcriptional regulator [Sagittula sp. P11]|uniref:AraC family transcriptional regulator n=1 Tax=Sagittula sp. P11 TaxID=2009329 RepID=UPI000C2D1BF0|nr:AraC family transcriptional regulator [Sagittula sp. P11]AUC54092.1 AraC family transcriptional regulator [Sagittula sp. P11]